MEWDCQTDKKGPTGRKKIFKIRIRWKELIHCLICQTMSVTEQTTGSLSAWIYPENKY